MTALLDFLLVIVVGHRANSLKLSVRSYLKTKSCFSRIAKGIAVLHGAIEYQRLGIFKVHRRTFTHREDLYSFAQKMVYIKTLVLPNDQGFWEVINSRPLVKGRLFG